VQKVLKQEMNSNLFLPPGQGVQVPNKLLFSISQKTQAGNGEHAWDRAYQEYVKLSAKGQTVAFIEPDAKTKYLKETPLKRSTAENSYLSSWPKPGDNLGVDEFIWHLDDQHSQLKKARERVAERVNSWTDTDKTSFNSSIRVAHIDTGYIPTHPSAPKRILEGTSFVKGEDGNKGIDILSNAGKFEQDGHGSATVAISGWKFYQRREFIYRLFRRFRGYSVCRSVACPNLRHGIQFF
jgi:hypothetical protein